MNILKREKTSVDMLFLLALFSVFVLCSLFIVLFGAKIYQKTADDMEQNFIDRTAFSYVTEKIHQHDYSDSIDIISLDNSSVLRLKNVSDMDTYYTYLYYFDGYLREITLSESSTFQKEDGTAIIKLLDFNMQKLSPSLYEFHVTDDKLNMTSFTVSVKSDQDKGGSANE